MKHYFSGKKSLVVGANSFLGKELMLRLSSNNNQVSGVYHKSTNNLTPGHSYIQIKELEKINDSFDYVFIVSAYVPGENKQVKPELFKEVNEELPAKICSKFKSSKIILASSVSLYEGANEIITENTGESPLSLYAFSKKKSEEIVRQHDKYSIIRISSMYGVGMKLLTFIPCIISDAISKGMIQLKGDGSRKQNYVHVSDVANMMITSAALQANGIYLGVSENSVSNTKVADIVANKIPGVKIVYNGEDMAKSYFYNASLTYSLLGYKRQITLKEGISEIIRWQQKKL